MIVSLTYDERQSYVARFCNSRPIKWLGEISMSFYMCHMVNPHTTRRLFILLLMREILERPLLFVQYDGLKAPLCPRHRPPALFP